MQLIQRFRFLISGSLLASFVLLLGSVVRAESDFEKVLRQQNQANVEGYMQPIADLFGANMHSGFNHSAYIPQSGFHFRLDIMGMAGLIQDDQNTYEAQAPAGYTPSKYTTPTGFGAKGGSVPNPTAPGDTNLAYKGSDGIFSTTIFPLASPQVTIGHVYGTEAVIRYVPIPEIGSLPAITLLGLGVRHSVSQYFEEFPVDVAVGAMYNSFTVGDLVTVKGYCAALQASKQLSVLILYGSLQMEKSTLTLSYKTTDPNATNQTINVDLEGSNVFRATIGGGLSLGFLKLYADANFGAITTISGGIGFGF